MRRFRQAEWPGFSLARGVFDPADRKSPEAIRQFFQLAIPTPPGFGGFGGGADIPAAIAVAVFLAAVVLFVFWAALQGCAR